MLVVPVLIGACAMTPWVGEDGNSADTGLRVAVLRPVPVPARSAHTTFQHGRPVRAANLFEPYCELELQDVQDARRTLAPTEYRVTRYRTRLLQDPITRIPALGAYPALGGGISCDDLYQESVLGLSAGAVSDGMQPHHMRCIMPYQDCRVGPPLSLDQMQLVVGRYLGITREP